MAWNDMVSFIIILAVVILSLALVAKWSMTFLIVFGMLVYGILTMTSRKPESYRFDYDVFLSFRRDPIDGLGDLLYRSFEDCGINAYIDQNKLSSRENVLPEVKKVIKRSRISIAVISPSYAYDKRCLGELEQMWGCRELHGQEIIPIFLGVSPTEVEEQTGNFGRYFDLLKTDGIGSKIIKRRWKKVLRQVGGLKGYGSDERRASEISKGVVLRVLHVLSNHGVENDDLAENAHVKEIMKKLDVADSEEQAVRIVGICGARDVDVVNKFAKYVFSKISKEFKACSFLNGINSKGLPFSRKMLIADLQKLKPASLREEIASLKVLIVLDYVHEDEQIEAS